MWTGGGGALGGWKIAPRGGGGRMRGSGQGQGASDHQESHIDAALHCQVHWLLRKSRCGGRGSMWAVTTVRILKICGILIFALAVLNEYYAKFLRQHPK